MPVTGISSAAPTVDPVASLVAALSSAADNNLKRDAINQSFTFTTVTATDANTRLPTAGAVRWADGTTGAFSAATFSTTWGVYTGFTVTYAGTTTKTVTVSGTLFDSYGNPYGTTVSVT